jgi:hypothetical protein
MGFLDNLFGGDDFKTALDKAGEDNGPRSKEWKADAVTRRFRMAQRKVERRQSHEMVNKHLQAAVDFMLSADRAPEIFALEEGLSRHDADIVIAEHYADGIVKRFLESIGMDATLLNDIANTLNELTDFEARAHCDLVRQWRDAILPIERRPNGRRT